MHKILSNILQKKTSRSSINKRDYADEGEDSYIKIIEALKELAF
jgi:hypothetical protein